MGVSRPLQGETDCKQASSVPNVYANLGQAPGGARKAAEESSPRPALRGPEDPERSQGGALTRDGGDFQGRLTLGRKWPFRRRKYAGVGTTGGLFK